MFRAPLFRQLRTLLSWLALCGALLVTAPLRAAAQACPGDCNGDAEVAIDEIIKGVAIALGEADLSACPAIDTNHDLQVTVDELVVAVADALNGCPATPTPTAMPIPTSAPTATPAPTMGTGNLSPTAVADAAATLAGESVPIFVLANDSDPNEDPLNVSTFTQPDHGTVGFTNDVATYMPNAGFSGTDSFTYTVSDGQGGTASATVTVVVNSVPPDPATAASAPTNGVATVVPAATRFLYTGADAVQFGVAPDTIATQRAAVVRGKVETRDGVPLPGVRITVLNHPEFGFTASRADGMFDIAVNGGGMLTIDYEKPGFCPVQRTVDVPWQDYVMAPDVVMIPLDPMVTSVTFGAGSAMQVAQSSMQADADGMRHAMMVFQPGTTAELVMADGTTQSAPALHVRATEFTVGPSGPAAMPALLPPTSAYTYCAEFSADEAMSAGAMMVAFNQPVITYVENFLGFPVGTIVPTGFYDRQKAAWVPLPNGDVIEILSITDGVADVDTDGDGAGDDGLDITPEERQMLASLYVAGQTLWRVPLSHFSVVDNNWSFLPVDATAPGQSGTGPDNDPPLENPCTSAGSVIECENMVLGESLPIVGTPYSLNYRSDREPGRAATRSFTLSGASVPDSLAGIDLHVSVGGRTFDQTFPPNPDQRFTFVWDRQDAYGRTLQGGQPLTGSIDYRYPVNYASSNTELAFGSRGGAVLLEGREGFSVSQPFSTVIGEGLTDARALGLGGWTLSIHHFFDPVARVVHLGDGRRQRADSLSRIITTVATSPPGRDVLAVGPDGSMYFVNATLTTLRRLAPDGTETVVAGGGNQFTPPFGDDGPALGATLFGPHDLAVGADGSLYVMEDQVIRRIGPDGIIRRFAGRYPAGDQTACNVHGPGADGVPATDSDLCPQSFNVGPDGSVYISEVGGSRSPFVADYARVRRVGPDGIITTVAGSAAQVCDNFFDPAGCDDGAPAIGARFGGLFDLAVAPDGTLYVWDVDTIKRIGVDGIIHRFASRVVSGLISVPSLAIAADGSLYVADAGHSRILRVGPDATVTTIAGSGESVRSGDGGPALAAGLAQIGRVEIAPDGTTVLTSQVLTSQGVDTSIRRIGAVLPGIATNNSLIASADGAQLYEFDGSGRHLRTLDALTGATLFEFGYDADGRLVQVTEKTGGTDNVTTIDHDGAGNPTAIIGPYGQVTTLDVDANGFLAGITNPAGESVQMTSDADGLLSSYTDPRGKTSTFSYDSLGRLTLDAAPAGASQTLARETTANEFTVTRTTALGRATTYQTENLAGNVQRRTVTEPDGSERQSTEQIDAATTHVTSSDGTTLRHRAQPRPALRHGVTGDRELYPSVPERAAVECRERALCRADECLEPPQPREPDRHLDGRRAHDHQQLHRRNANGGHPDCRRPCPDHDLGHSRPLRTGADRQPRPHTRRLR
jgi:YD repeat-containing protein